MNKFWKGKHGPMLIAEIGGNHEGNFEYAKRLTELAIASNVDYVKFQIYTGDGLVNAVEGPVRNEHFKKFELEPEQHIELAKMCKNAGIGYLASVWIPEAIDWVDSYSDFYKIGSGDLTAYQMIKTLTKTKKPLLISTGLAKESEVIDTIDFIRKCDAVYQNDQMIGILQCTSMYPIPPEDANLSVITRLKEITGCCVGYSDHTEGMKALITSVAMGADILEFHFTDDRAGKTFRDHKVSLTKDEVQVLISEIDVINKLKGDQNKQPLPVEGDHLTSFRRALYPSRDLPAGTKITELDLVSMRPNHGIDACEFQSLTGKQTRRSLRKHERLNWEDFE